MARELYRRVKRKRFEDRRFEGITRRGYLERLRHRRWAAQFPYPRLFGYVVKWDEIAGEGVVRDQEKTQDYLVIREEIGRCYHNHKTLQEAEFVEFFATDELDGETGLYLAKNVTGPLGRYVKESQEYRDRMLRNIMPKRWMDTPDEYEAKLGEWWTKKKWNCERRPKTG